MKQIKYLQWDSDFFGFNIAALSGSYNAEQLLEKINELKKQQYHLAYWSVDFSDKISKTASDKLKISLICEKLIFENNLKNKLILTENNISIRELIEPINNNLIDLAISSGEYSRFKKDPKFELGSFEKMYTQWILKSYSKELADKIFVAELKNKIEGLITVKNQNGKSEIGLIAVKKEFRGMGIGIALVKKSLNYAFENYCKSAIVSTQKENIIACNLYTSCNYKIVQHKLIYHIWL